MRVSMERSSRWRMKLSRAVQDFLQDRRVSLSPGSLTAYESDLSRLVALASPDSVLVFTGDLVRLYFTSLSQQGAQMSTLARKYSVLNEFGRWGVRKKLWLTNPLDDYDRPPYPERLPRPFTSDEISRIMALDLPPVERVLRGLLYFTGLRVTPISNLTVGDLSFAEVTFEDGVRLPGSIRSTGKGNVSISTPMHPDLKEILFNWVLERTDMKGSSRLIEQSNGRPYNRKLVEKAARRWGRSAQVPQCLPHRFRHTFATELLRQGTDIRVIQKLLAHRDIKTTMLYTKVFDSQLSAAVLKLPSH